MTQAEGKDYSVINSKGLFAYPEEKKDLATKTGLWDENLYDVELAQRMNDEEFEEFINQKIKNITSNILSLGPFEYTPFGAVTGQTINNNTDQIIRGEEYSLTLHYDLPYFDHETQELVNNEGFSTEKGKYIPPHGSVVFDCVFDRYIGTGGSA